ASPNEFYGLAAEHLRRRLLDLTRRYANPVRSPALLSEDQGGRLPSPSDDEMDRWQALHEAAQQLPADCREVFALRFYHGWDQEQIAERLQVSTRTVTRLWSQALLALNESVGEAEATPEVKVEVEIPAEAPPETETTSEAVTA